jgi:pimeloyl-ACP methyl ester carboxylesterase
MLRLQVAMSMLAVLCVPSPVVGQEAGSAERFFDSDGVRIRYLDIGEGDAVVLLHGFALSAEVNWGLTGLLDSLPQEYRMLALDQRGHGLSDKPHDPEDYGLEFVEDVVRLLEELEIEKAHIVGYSMGGSLALRLAAGHPDRVRSVVIGGAGWASPGTPLPPGLRDWPAKIERIAEEGGSLTDAMWLPGWPDPTPEIRAFLDANDARALAAVLRSRPEWDDLTAASVSAIGVPVLAVIGEADFARPAVDALVNVKPDVEVSVLTGKSHATAVFDDELGQVVLEFLREQR